MYCSNCGKEVAENAKFCKFCGENVWMPDSDSDSNEGGGGSGPGSGRSSGNPEEEWAAGSMGMHSMKQEQLIQKNVPYYTQQFRIIESGGRPNFNWAVFFGGPIVPLYRKSFSFFQRYYLPYFIGWVTSLFLFGYCMDLMAGAIGSADAPEVVAEGAIIICVTNLLISIWGIIVLILCAKRFNLDYYFRVKEKIVNNVPEGSDTFGIAHRYWIAAFLLFFLVNGAIGISIGISTVSKIAQNANSLWNWSEELDGSGDPFYEPGLWNDDFDSGGSYYYDDGDSDSDVLYFVTAYEAYGIFIRSSPSASYSDNILYRISPGDTSVRLKYMDEETSVYDAEEGRFFDWYQVELPDGRVGWVRQDVVKAVF